MSRIVSDEMSLDRSIAATVASTLPITSATDRPISSPVSAMKRSGSDAATFSMRDDADASMRTSNVSRGASVSPTRMSNAAMAARTSSETKAQSEGISMLASAIWSRSADWYVRSRVERRESPPSEISQTSFSKRTGGHNVIPRLVEVYSAAMARSMADRRRSAGCQSSVNTPMVCAIASPVRLSPSVMPPVRTSSSTRAVDVHAMRLASVGSVGSPTCSAP